MLREETKGRGDKVPAPAVASIFERFDSFHFGWKRRGGVFDVIFCIFLPEFFCCFSQLSFLSARDFISKTTESQCRSLFCFLARGQGKDGKTVLFDLMVVVMVVV